MTIGSASYEALLAAIAIPRHQLLSHPVYTRVQEPAALRAFMGVHVFAVWDFMSLLKALQRRLTCIDVPWLPPPSRTAARLINEIVLGEESDQIAPGLTMSHFELYLDAMTELDADSRPIRAFLAGVAATRSVSQALTAAEVPPPAARFVERTLAVATEGSIETIAAAFLIGREDLVPAMFRRLLPAIAEVHETASLRRYLARHIEVDEAEHGPLARRLLVELCGDDPVRWQAATEAARGALAARCQLWDGVVELIDTAATRRR